MKKTEKILIRCDSKLKKELRNLAEEKGITMSEILDKSIRKELKASRICTEKKTEKDAVKQTSKQDAQMMAGCVYHAQNILNILEQENQECNSIRKEVEALWDLLN